MPEMQKYEDRANAAREKLFEDRAKAQAIKQERVELDRSLMQRRQRERDDWLLRNGDHRDRTRIMANRLGSRV